MTFFQKVIDHFQGLVILSDNSIMLIGACLIIMSLTALYFLFFKADYYEKYMPLIGIAIRVLMFIGFTLEFAHHTKISPILAGDEGKEYTIRQLSNYLLYAYVLVVGVYDILTIGINKFRGFFHAFDISMVSLPLIYTLTAFAVYMPKNRIEAMDILVLALLFSMVLMIYLFFQVYWKQTPKWYIIFFVVGILVVGITLSIQFKYPQVLPIFLLLLGGYEGIKLLIKQIKAKGKAKVWKGLKLSSTVIILIIMIFGLNFIGINLLSSKEVYMPQMLFNRETSLITIQQAESTARAALKDNKSRFILTSTASMDFYNCIFAVLGDYRIEISEATGKVNNINFEDLKKAHPGKTTTDKIKNKTVELLKNCGYTYDSSKTDINIRENANFYEVNIKNKFSDGKSNNSDSSRAIGITWFNNGELSHFSAPNYILDLKDYKDIKIDEAIIKSSIEAWYKKLGEKMPNYAVEDYNGAFAYSNKNNNLTVICDNGNSLSLDIKDGTVRSFFRDGNSNVRLSNEAYEKYKGKAETIANEMLSSNESKYVIDERYGKNLYTLIRDNKGIKSFINLSLDNEGNFKSFFELYNIAFSQYGKSDISISKNKALSLVADKYRFFGIYTKRAKLIEELQINGQTKPKWMVIVIPYMSREHHIYFVDVKTGEISSLQSYKEGLENE